MNNMIRSIFLEGLMMDRRHFLAGAAAMALTARPGNAAAADAVAAAKLARLSVSSSTYRAHYDGRFSAAGALPRLSHRTLAAHVKQTFGISRIELWDQQFGPAGHSFAECRAIRAAADAVGVQVVSVEVEDMPRLDASDPDDRAQAVAEGKVWLEKARVLGCTSMRFNVNRSRSEEVNREAAIEVLRQMADHGRRLGVVVLLENHGGATANIAAMVELVRAVNHKFVKAEPDWGAWVPPGERYQAMQSAMEVAHIVSAKGQLFDPDTYAHTSFDVARLAREAEATGFKGVYSIELYNTPAPADTDRAVWSMIRAIAGEMR
jgi:sugar phosphate isomerase/epimerase